MAGVGAAVGRGLGELEGLELGDVEGALEGLLEGESEGPADGDVEGLGLAPQHANCFDPLCLYAVPHPPLWKVFVSKYFGSTST